MQALVIRHAPQEALGGFRSPLEAAGYEITYLDVDHPDFDQADFLAPDLLILMGGPMGVYEKEAHPWISAELVRLSLRLAADRPTLGICFGAQLIAAALGARVYAGDVREVGFSPISITADAKRGYLRHLDDVALLHWHGDTFDLPDGVKLEASSNEYENQIFSRGANLLAIQCHPEMGEDESFEEWLEDVDYVRSAGTDVDSLRSDYELKGPDAVAAGRAMLVDWLAQIDA
jgi:GMP synthase (glutamine-hydrolysing)